jgi:hypothetical protein
LPAKYWHFIDAGFAFHVQRNAEFTPSTITIIRTSKSHTGVQVLFTPDHTIIRT